MESIKPDDYGFICLNNKPKNYSGVFFKNNNTFDFKSCLKFLLQYVDIRRKNDVKIKSEGLLRSFKKNHTDNLFATSSIINLFDTTEILDVLKLFKDLVSNEQNKIELNSDILVFKRTTKKLKYEFIADILNEYKKPMHFTEIYEECLRIGIRVTSALSIHGLMQHYPKVFGLKGPGIYGLLEWGGYFGKIGDVAERVLKEKKEPMDKKELINILCRELYISQDSINTVLFFYGPEKRNYFLLNEIIIVKILKVI